MEQKKNAHEPENHLYKGATKQLRVNIVSTICKIIWPTCQYNVNMLLIISLYCCCNYANCPNVGLIKDSYSYYWYQGATLFLLYVLISDIHYSISAPGCLTWHFSVLALIQHHAVHTLKLPVLDLSLPQGRDQHCVLGPEKDTKTAFRENYTFKLGLKWTKWLFIMPLRDMSDLLKFHTRFVTDEAKCKSTMVCGWWRISARRENRDRRGSQHATSRRITPAS